MNRLLDWHLNVGRVGLRLFCLHLLWVAWTLRGGVLLGLFPATAAVFAVLRADVLRSNDAATDDPPPLRPEFRRFYRAEFAVANRLGYLLAVCWAFVVVDRRLVAQLDLGTLGPMLAGALTVAGVALAVVSVHAWLLQAHFDEGARALLRRSAVLAMARPATAVVGTAAVGLVACLYYLVPGLVPVFGIAAPAALATAQLWRSGVLAPPPTAPVDAGHSGARAAHPTPS